MNAMERVRAAVQENMQQSAFSLAQIDALPMVETDPPLIVGDLRTLLALADAAVAVCEGIDDDTTALYLSPSEVIGLQRAALAALTEPTP